eukprot:11196883-Lingulodinium_polyedra.AAC.1
MTRRHVSPSTGLTRYPGWRKAAQKAVPSPSGEETPLSSTWSPSNLDTEVPERGGGIPHQRPVDGDGDLPLAPASRLALLWVQDSARGRDLGQAVQLVEDIAVAERNPLAPSCQPFGGCLLRGGFGHFVAILSDLGLAQACEGLVQEGVQGWRHTLEVGLQSQAKHDPDQLVFEPASVQDGCKVFSTGLGGLGLAISLLALPHPSQLPFDHLWVLMQQQGKAEGEAPCVLQDGPQPVAAEVHCKLAQGSGQLVLLHHQRVLLLGALPCHFAGVHEET